MYVVHCHQSQTAFKPKVLIIVFYKVLFDEYVDGLHVCFLLCSQSYESKFRVRKVINVCSPLVLLNQGFSRQELNNGTHGLNDE